MKPHIMDIKPWLIRLKAIALASVSEPPFNVIYLFSCNTFTIKQNYFICSCNYFLSKYRIDYLGLLRPSRDSVNTSQLFFQVHLEIGGLASNSDLFLFFQSQWHTCDHGQVDL